MAQPGNNEFKPLDDQHTLLEVGSDSQGINKPQDRTVSNTEVPKTMLDVQPTPASGQPSANSRNRELVNANVPGPARAPQSASLENLRFGQVRITQQLGAGGMGKVYRGHHEGLDIDVAVKVMSGDLAKDVTARQRFMREARTAAKLDHPNVVRVLTVDELDGAPYIVMEFVDGSDMAALVKQSGKLMPVPTFQALAQVADGLNAAHEQGIIHRDIKPHNIFVAKNGRVKLGDFGLARATEQTTELTMPGSAMGTANYMSPEQASGHELTAKSDVYSLGITAYHLLCGQPPYTGTTPLSIAVQHVNSDVPYDRARFGHVPDPAVYLLIAMTARDPARRPSAAQASTQLRQILRQLTGSDDTRVPGIDALTRSAGQATFASAAPVQAVAQPMAMPPTIVPQPPPVHQQTPSGPAFHSQQVSPTITPPGFNTQPQQRPPMPVWQPQPQNSNPLLWIAIVAVVLIFLLFGGCVLAVMK